MNSTHLRKFKELHRGEAERNQAVKNMKTRRDVFSIIERSNDIVKDCSAILDWGGMHGENRRRIVSQPDKSWLKLAKQAKIGNLNRFELYSEFSDLQARDKLKGMGPAYFTKLIYFLMPDDPHNPRGYIMDQWVGCAVNILNDSDVVLMDSSYTKKWSKARKIKPDSNYQVTNVNTVENYKSFCRQIEILAEEISVKPDFAECLLMSKGGTKPLEWRAYVKANRRPCYE